MKWSEVSVHTTQEALEAVANILHEAGASGVVIEDQGDLSKAWEEKYGEMYELDPKDFPEEGVIVKAYFPVNSFLGETIEQIKVALNNLLLYDIDLGRGSVTCTEIQEEDWAYAWKKYYKPVHISEKIVISPTWEEYEAKPGEILIELDPGMAFGTGTHPTTRMSLLALEKYVKGGERVADVGCGSGVLSIAAAKLGAASVLALDIDELAVKVTRMNARLNKVQDKIRVQQNNLLDEIDGPFDLVVANILAEVIVRFVDRAFQVLSDRGLFVVSGIIQKKEELVRERLASEGFEILEVLRMEDWIAIVAQKAG